MTMTTNLSSSSAPPAWANPSPMNTSTSQEEEVEMLDDSILLQPYSTLDEPVRETIMRDLRAVGSKLRVVMLPLDSRHLGIPAFGYNTVENSEHDGQQQQPQQQQHEEMSENQKRVLERLKDWDLWGPLIVCLGTSVLLSLRAPTEQSSLVFAAVFLSVWGGATIVTLNAQLLGSHISFFQSVCVIGYCVFPMMVAALIIGILHLVHIAWWWLDLILIIIGFLWATRASTVFIGLYIPQERKALAVFPVLFFYIFLGWLILLF